METASSSSERSFDAPFGAADEEELLDILLDDHDSLFEMDFSSLQDIQHATVAPVRRAPALDCISDPGFQLQTTTHPETQAKEAKAAGSSPESAKRVSTFHRRKEELAYLHSRVAELEAQLSELRSTGRLTASTDGAIGQSLRETAASLSLWKVVARRQLSERNRAEQENVELHKLLKEQAGLAKSLKQMLRKRLAPLKRLHERDQQQPVEVCDQDSEVFQVLLRNIEQRTRTVDSIFEAHGLTPTTTKVDSMRVVSSPGQAAHVELVNATLLAFDLQLVMSTIWNMVSARQSRSDGQNVHVVKFTDEVLLMKQVFHPLTTSSAGGSGLTIILSVLKRLTQENRELLVWERLIEKNGAAASGTPSTYLSQFGCAQIARMNNKNTREGQSASLAQSYVQLKPIQSLKSHAGAGKARLNASTHIDTMADMQMLAATYQQNRQNFLHYIENELESLIRGVARVQL